MALRPVGAVAILDCPQTREGLGKENRAGLGALRTRPLLAKGEFFTSSAGDGIRKKKGSGEDRGGGLRS